MEQYESHYVKVFKCSVPMSNHGIQVSFRMVFSTHQDEKIRRMIASLLAGYAWDASNPIHRNAKQRLSTLAEYCRGRTTAKESLTDETLSCV